MVCFGATRIQKDPNQCFFLVNRDPDSTPGKEIEVDLDPVFDPEQG